MGLLYRHPLNFQTVAFQRLSIIVSPLFYRKSIQSSRPSSWLPKGNHAVDLGCPQEPKEPGMRRRPDRPARAALLLDQGGTKALVRAYADRLPQNARVDLSRISIRTVFTGPAGLSTLSK